MSVKPLENGDFFITVPNPLAISGTSTKRLPRAFAEEFIKFLDSQAQVAQERRTEGEWPPLREEWEIEGENAIISHAPDGRTAVILQTKNGLHAGKWREKNRDVWITRMGIDYSPEEIIELFRARYREQK